MASPLPPDKIAEKIRTMLRRDLKLGNIELTDEMPLVGSNMDLDSLDILLLVTNIEKEFAIRIASQEVGKQAFETVGSLIGFVLTKVQVQAGNAGVATSSTAAGATTDDLSMLPHREPFRFLTKVLSVQADVQGEGLWAVSGSEPFFAGHFPGMPLVPGVLLAESLAQLSGIVGATAVGQRGKLAQVDVKFVESVSPPAEIRLSSRLLRELGALKQFEVKATVGAKVAAEGTLAIAYG